MTGNVTRGKAGQPPLNVIELLDRVRIEEEALEKPPYDAVLAVSVQRLRPILLTTASTVMGLLPLWWGGSAMFKPMAISIIFGLLFATVLTLFVVAVIYASRFRIRAPG